MTEAHNICFFDGLLSNKMVLNREDYTYKGQSVLARLSNRYLKKPFELNQLYVFIENSSMNPLVSSTSVVIMYDGVFYSLEEFKNVLTQLCSTNIDSKFLEDPKYASYFINESVKTFTQFFGILTNPRGYTSYKLHDYLIKDPSSYSSSSFTKKSIKLFYMYEKEEVCCSYFLESLKLVKVSKHPLIIKVFLGGLFLHSIQPYLY